MSYSIDKEKKSIENKPREVEIHPAKKWKRILLYLGDMMLSFIACFVLFSAAIYPLSMVFVKYNAAETVQAGQERDDILYYHQLLFYKDDEFEKYNFTDNLKYTYNRFLAYYAFSSEDSVIDSSHPEYSHQNNNEVIKTYFVDIRDDSLTYQNLYKEYDEFFVVDEQGHVSLLASVQESVKYYFDPEEKLESDDYKNLSEVFAAMYGKIISIIMKEDLTYIDVDLTFHSYIRCQDIIDTNASIYNWRMSISLMISFALSTFIIHILYPLINKRRRTPLMSIMQLDRLGVDSLKPLGKLETAFSGVYPLVFDLPYILFVPLSYTTILTIFDLPLIFVLFLIGLLLILISLIIMLIQPFNRTASDLLSRSIIVPAEDIDAVDQAKNYGK